jgi:hypothetical protein
MAEDKHTGDKTASSPDSIRVAYRIMAIFVAGLLLTLVATNVAVSRTSLWFFQPWIGPLARQNVGLHCVMDVGYAGDIVILGDSRARHDFISGAITEELADQGSPPVLNLGLDAAQLVSMRDITWRLTELERPPKIYILTVAAYTLNDHNPRFERDLRLYASPELMARGLLYCPDWSQKHGALAGMTRGIEVLYQLPAWKKARGQCSALALGGGSYLYPFNDAIMKHNNEVVPHHGDEARARAFDNEIIRVKDEMLREMEIGDFPIRLFNETLDMIDEQGATAVVLLTPEAPDFRDIVKVPLRDEAEDLLREICEKRGITYVDLNQAPFAPDKEDYFDLSDHLLPEPAAELSRKVAREVIAPVLESGS